MYSAEDVVKTAAEIQPYLPSLLDAASARQLADQLTPLLSEATPPPAADPAAHSPTAAQQIMALLSQQKTTREWLRLALEERHTADTILKLLNTYQPLAGSTSTIESPHYVCPVSSCHQQWYRHDPEEAIPLCPIHNVQLVRDSKGH